MSIKRTVRLVQLKMVREKVLQYENSIRMADDVVNMIKPIFENSYREMVAVIGLNNNNIPTVVHIVGTGSVSQSNVSIGNVFKPLLLSNSASFIICHNHPADTLRPSEADQMLTEKLKGLGKELEIELLDHIIMNANADNHYSFKQNRLL